MVSTAICPCGYGRLAVYQDSVTERGYCIICASSEITSSLDVHLQYLSDLVPYEVGERVECWTMAEFYEGYGTVVATSTELRDGGTPDRPAVLVKMEGRDEKLWFVPLCLKRAKGDQFA